MKASLLLSVVVCVGVCAFSVAGPTPPVWPNHSVSWEYVDSDNVTVLSRHSFWWYEDMNFRTVMGHFDERPPPNGVAPMAGWANFTSQCTVRYDPAYGKFGLEYPCVAQPWDRTFEYDQTFNNCRVPSSYKYMGQRMIDGVMCNGWHFIAVNYPAAAGNTMWTATPQEFQDERPIRMDILHNGRSIRYLDFQSPAEGYVQFETSQFCSSIDWSPCSDV